MFTSNHKMSISASLQRNKMDACMDPLMHGRLDAWMHGDVDMDAWMHGCMDAWRHGCMEAWRHGGMHVLFKCFQAPVPVVWQLVNAPYLCSSERPAGASLGGATCLTLLVKYGLVCFARCLLCQGYYHALLRCSPLSKKACVRQVHMIHFKLGSFPIGLVSNWAQF